MRKKGFGVRNLQAWIYNSKVQSKSNTARSAGKIYTRELGDREIEKQGDRVVGGLY